VPLERTGAVSDGRILVSAAEAITRAYGRDRR